MDTSPNARTSSARDDNSFVRLTRYIDLSFSDLDALDGICNHKKHNHTKRKVPKVDGLGAKKKKS